MPVSRTIRPTLFASSSCADAAAVPPEADSGSRKERTWFGATKTTSSSPSISDEEGEATAGREKRSESGRPSNSGGAASISGNGKDNTRLGAAVALGGGAGVVAEMGNEPVSTEIGTSRGAPGAGAGIRVKPKTDVDQHQGSLGCDTHFGNESRTECGKKPFTPKLGNTARMTYEQRVHPNQPS